MVDNYDGPVLRSYEPTLRERLAAFLMGDNKPSVERRNFAEGASRLVPVIGLQEATRAAQAGRYGTAALEAAGSLPLAGPEARTGTQIARQAMAARALRAPARDLVTADTRALTAPGTSLAPAASRDLAPATQVVREAEPNIALGPRVVGGESAADDAAQYFRPGNTNLPSRGNSAVDKALAALGAGSAGYIATRDSSPGTDPAEFARLDYVAPQSGYTGQEQRFRPMPQEDASRAKAAAVAQIARDIPLPPRRDIPLPPRWDDSAPRARPDYQSNGRDVVDSGRINWGDAESPADFFRASKALQDNPDMSGYRSGGGVGSGYRSGGSVHPMEVHHALSVLHRALGGR